MLWWGSVPSIGTVILRVAGPQDREIADDIAVSTANNSNWSRKAFLIREQ